MKEFTGCLLACDVDDTLMSNGVIPERNMEQIERFMAAGGQVSLATGRTVAAVSPVLAGFKQISPCVLANGCMLYDFEMQKIVEQSCIEKAEHRIARHMSACGLDMGVEVHCADRIFIVKDHKEVRDHEAYEHYTGEKVSFEEIDGFDWNKVLYLFADEKEREKGKEIIRSLCPDSSFSDTSAVIGERQRFYYEQFPVGVSKATGVKRLAEILQIRPGGLFAMGDYYNDLPMMEKADICATTAGAPDEIKHMADFVGGTCAAGAVADFIEYLFNRKE